MKKIIISLGLLVLFPFPAFAASSLTNSQIQSILGLLRAFGAESSVISNVESQLEGSLQPAPINPAVTQPVIPKSVVDLKVNDLDGSVVNIAATRTCTGDQNATVATCTYKVSPISISWSLDNVSFPGCAITSTKALRLPAQTSQGVIQSADNEFYVTRSGTVRAGVYLTNISFGSDLPPIVAKIMCPTPNGTMIDSVKINLVVKSL